MMDNLPTEEFSIQHFGDSCHPQPFCILKDNVTGVEYIVSVHGESHCVIPRLHPDGSLYCGPEKSLSDADRHAQYLSRKQKLEDSKVRKRQEARE